MVQKTTRRTEAGKDVRYYKKASEIEKDIKAGLSKGVIRKKIAYDFFGKNYPNIAVHERRQVNVIYEVVKDLLSVKQFINLLKKDELCK